MEKPNAFQQTVKNYLDNRSKQDEAFAATYAKPNKSIEECCKYIYREVAKKRVNGENCVALSDEEVFGMAVHYYDEDDITVTETVSEPQVATSAPTPKPAKKRGKSKKAEEPKPIEPEPQKDEPKEIEVEVIPDDSEDEPQPAEPEMGEPEADEFPDELEIELF